MLDKQEHVITALRHAAKQARAAAETARRELPLFTKLCGELAAGLADGRELEDERAVELSKCVSHLSEAWCADTQTVRAANGSLRMLLDQLEQGDDADKEGESWKNGTDGDK